MYEPTAASSQELLADLRAVLSHDRVSSDPADQLIYSRDMWPRTLLAVQADDPVVSPPGCVVWPASTGEVAEIVRVATAHRVPIVPWGGGSGVCGGSMAVKGGIVVDLKRMCSMLDVSRTDKLATFEAGMIGQTLEDELNLRGLTLGHFPSSITCSTLGGWLATRSAGQMSSRYGKIEDMVDSLRVVLGTGEVVDCAHRDKPNVIDLFVGSEGTLGIITEATLRVHPLPEYRVFRAYRFPRVSAGCEGMRRVMQLGLRAAVLRLYDETDTLFAHPTHDAPGATQQAFTKLLNALPAPLRDPASPLRSQLLRSALTHAGTVSSAAGRVVPHVSRGCLLILGIEGTKAIAQNELALCHAELEASGGTDLGEAAGTQWYNNRYSVAYKQSPLYAAGGFVDTMEVATTWNGLMELYTTVRQALAQRAVVLAHFSHAYPEGCSIYFTFAASAPTRRQAEDLYDDIWRQGLSAATRAGGTISHHHGVGASKSSFMAQEHGEAMHVYRRTKTMLDPLGLLNPAKMGL